MPVFDHDTRAGAPQAAGIDDRTCESPEKLCIRFRGVEVLQSHLTMRPGEVKYTVRKVAVPVFLYKFHHFFPALSYACHKIHRGYLVRLKHYVTSSGNYRIKHRSLRIAHLSRSAHRSRLGRIFPSSNELGTIRFIRNFPFRCGVDRDKMEHIRHGIILGPFAASAENGLFFTDYFRLYKKFAESGVHRVSALRSQNHFRVAGKLQDFFEFRTVSYCNAPQFDVVFRRNSYFGVGVNLPVLAPELGLALREDGFVTPRHFTYGLVSCRPYFSLGHIPYITE